MKTRTREATCARRNCARIVQENTDKTRTNMKPIGQQALKCKGKLLEETVGWNNEKTRRITLNDCKHFGSDVLERKLRNMHRRETTKAKHLPTPCEGRTLKELGRLARRSLDDGL